MVAPLPLLGPEASITLLGLPMTGLEYQVVVTCFDGKVVPFAPASRCEITHGG